MAHKAIKIKHHRLNMHELSYLQTSNWVVCRLHDSHIYLHAIDQSQCIKQLQCIIICIIAKQVLILAI